MIQKRKIKKREKERNAIIDYREKMFGLLIDQASGIKKMAEKEKIIVTSE